MTYKKIDRIDEDETINLDVIRKLAKLNFETLKAEKDGNYMAEIKFYNYYDMMFTAVNMLKLCMLALDHEAPEIPNTIKDRSIDIRSVLETALQLMPLSEMEFLDEVN